MKMRQVFFCIKKIEMGIDKQYYTMYSIDNEQ